MALYVDTVEKQIKTWLQDPKAGQYVAGRNWLGLCQALMYQLCAKFGTAKTVHSSATVAMKASGKLNKDYKTAPVGAFHYWSWVGSGSQGKKDYGHVAFDLAGGGKRVLTANSWASPKWGTNVGISSVPNVAKHLPTAKYLGWSMKNGNNSCPVQVLEPNERVVVPNGVNVRFTPDSGSFLVKTLKSGTVVKVIASAFGETVKGNNVWFQVGEGWCWSGGFTDASVAGIPEYVAPEPIPEPVEPEPVEPEPIPDPEPTPEPIPEIPESKQQSGLIALLGTIAMAVAALLAWLFGGDQ